MHLRLSFKNFFVKSLLLTFLLLCFGLNIFSQKKVVNKSFSKKVITEKSKKNKTSRVFYGEASFYSDKFNGRRTASGEIYSQNKRTCACNVLPLGTWIKVTNVKNGKSIIVKVNDRLHPKMRRIVDLTKTDAVQLGYASAGVGRVKVDVIGKKKK